MGVPLTVGVDVGNAFLKVYEGARRRWLAPNVIDFRTDTRLVEGHAETADSWLDLEFLSSPATLPTRIYIGELAVRRGGAARPLVTSKLRDEHTAIAFVAALARTVAHRLKGMPKAERDAYLNPEGKGYTVPVIVGTGCPIHQFDGEQAAADKKLFGSRVKGKHLVRFVDTPEYKDLGQLEIDVQRIMLYQEGVAGLADYRYDDAGALRKRGELEAYGAVVDLGANTLDFAVQREDGAIDPLLTGGRDFGLAEAMDQLTAAINDKYKRRYTRAQLVGDLVNLDYSIPSGNERIPVWETAKHYLQRVADEVLAIARKLQNDSQNRLGLMLFVGGGAAALRRFLEPSLESASFQGVSIEWMNEPLYANAGGYYKRTVAKLAEERAKVGGADA